MSGQNGSTTTSAADAQFAESKGKGKAVEPAQDVEMDVDDSSSDEEVEPPVAEEEDEDNMEEIDTSNIVYTRTRGGTKPDYVKAAEELGGDDDDEDDDDDFEPNDETMED